MTAVNDPAPEVAAFVYFAAQARALDSADAPLRKQYAERALSLLPQYDFFLLPAEWVQALYVAGKGMRPMDGIGAARSMLYRLQKWAGRA
jgi:hypothetical protein